MSISDDCFPRTIEVTFLTSAPSFEDDGPSLVTIRTYTLLPTALGREIWNALAASTTKNRVVDNAWLLKNLAPFGYIERVESSEHRRVFVQRTSDIDVVLCMKPSADNIDNVRLLGWDNA